MAGARLPRKARPRRGADQSHQRRHLRPRTAEVIARIPAAGPLSIEREVFPNLVEDGALFAFASDAYWIDTGTPERYIAALVDLVRRAPPGPHDRGPRGAVSRRPGRRRGGRSAAHARAAGLHRGTTAASMPASALVSGAGALGARCRIEEGAVVEGPLGTARRRGRRCNAGATVREVLGPRGGARRSRLGAGGAGRRRSSAAGRGVVRAGARFSTARDALCENPAVRALVTGGAGFIGSTLVDRLLAEGHAVDVIDDLSSGSLANLAAARTAGRAFSFHHLDITAPEVADPLAMRRPEVVFHLAAFGARRARSSGFACTMRR